MSEKANKEMRSSLKDSLKLEGVGLHSGKRVRLRLEPAPAGAGVIFRSPRRSQGQIKLSPAAVVSTLNAVTVSNGQWSVQTVEHLLAALYATGISDIIVALDHAEIPIMDGSAYPFYEAITQTGVVSSRVEFNPLSLGTAVWVVEGDSYLIALPQKHLSVTYSISYAHPYLQKQNLCMRLDREIIAKEILPARTFGLLQDVEAMKAQGLIKGASVENAIVISESGYVNESLRFPDECLRHKVLDLIGDLYLLGRPLNAHLIAFKAGHALDVALTRKILGYMQADELNLRKSRLDSRNRQYGQDLPAWPKALVSDTRHQSFSTFLL